MVALLCSGSVGTAAAQEAYRLTSGDTVEVVIAGHPDLRQKMTLNIDGEISVPLVGSVVAGDLTVTDLRAKLQQVMPGKPVRQRSAEGKESTSFIDPNEISVQVVEYRPVYLNGDVAKPGEQIYRPGMTIRQAVAVAGGYDVVKLRSNNPLVELAELRSDLALVSSELAFNQAREKRLRSDLSGQGAAGVKPENGPGLQAGITRDMISLEVEQLATTLSDVENEKIYLRRQIAKAEERRRTLVDQQQKETEGLQADAEDLERVRELYGKGLAAAGRLTDVRRALLLSSTRALQTGAQALQSERDRDDNARKLQHLDDQRKIDNLKELEEVIVRVATLRAKLQSAKEKLVIVGNVRSQLLTGSTRPELTLVRATRKQRINSRVDEETEMLPGDVVEIKIPLDSILRD
ncbi:polysaccharide biosynthesis/export family protein [Methylorubrum aminovorans]